MNYLLYLPFFRPCATRETLRADTGKSQSTITKATQTRL